MRMHRSSTVSPLRGLHGGAQVYWLPPEHRQEVGTSSCADRVPRSGVAGVVW
jgi:hypothetical protein